MQRRWQSTSLLLAMLVLIAILLSLRSGIQAPSVSAIETGGTLGAYWDFNCVTAVTSVNWENLTPGQTKNESFFVRNEASTPAYLVASDNNWNPTEAQNYIQFAFDAQNQKVDGSEVRKVTCSLTISREIKNVSNFTFNIFLKGTESLPGDLNNDGTVNIKDIALLVSLFGTTPASPKWDPNADLNGNLRVDIRDIALAIQDFGNTAT